MPPNCIRTRMAEKILRKLFGLVRLLLCLMTDRLTVIKVISVIGKRILCGPIIRVPMGIKRLLSNWAMWPYEKNRRIVVLVIMADFGMDESNLAKKNQMSVATTTVMITGVFMIRIDNSV